MRYESSKPATELLLALSYCAALRWAGGSFALQALGRLLCLFNFACSLLCESHGKLHCTQL